MLDIECMSIIDPMNNKHKDITLYEREFKNSHKSFFFTKYRFFLSMKTYKVYLHIEFNKISNILKVIFPSLIVVTFNK